MSVALTAATIPAGESTVASVAARDQFGAPMTIGDVAWTSSAPSVASISSSGAITALSVGTTVITARLFAVYGQATLTVSPPPPGPSPVVTVAVAPLSAQLEAGTALPLVATLRDYAGNVLSDRDIVWSSTDNAVATVSPLGVVTALRSGTAVIEAVSETRRGTFALSVSPVVDSAIVIGIPYPYPQSVVGDTITVVAVVMSPNAIVSVTAAMGGQPIAMRYGPIGNTGVLGNGQQAMGWSVALNLTTLPFGPYALVVTATDDAGHRRVRAIPLVRNPRVDGGSKNPVGSK